jgi:hypothetical protein
MVRSFNPGRGKKFFIFLENTQTASVAHPASNFMGTGLLFLV